VFWGVAVIGMTGLILWFPTVFTHIMPGWMVNVATTIHSDEALLAVCFIFSIHFFNTHFRPEKFPIDTVIFTGAVSEHELKEERPAEYERLRREHRLDALAVAEPTPAMQRYGRIVGGIALTTGVVLFLLILRAALL
jgi:hypothetical protein